MAAEDPAVRSRIASIAVHTSWANTPNRADRTAPARAASPVQFEYWLAWAKTTYPDMSRRDQVKAATNAWRARQRSAAEKAAKKKAARKRANSNNSSSGTAA